MGKRDMGSKESKKPKKDAKKPGTSSMIVPPAEVEVVRKGKKNRGDDF